MDFMIEITEARDLPSQFCSGVYCEYSFFLDDKKYITQSVYIELYIYIVSI